MAREQLNRRDESIARVTRPDQSAAKTAFLDAVSRMDGLPYEELLKVLAVALVYEGAGIDDLPRLSTILREVE